MRDFSFDGRRVVVTGASRGIGFAIARAFAHLGANILGVARRVESPDGADSPERLSSIAADVATADGRAGVLDRVRSQWGALDVLVNNVGTNIRKPSTDYTDAEVRTIVDTNMMSALELCRGAYPLLCAGHDPAIVNVSSVASTLYLASGVVYAMTKAAIDQMTRYLAVEWAPRPAAGDQPACPGVRVNAVCPWYIRTPLVEPVLSDPARLSRIIDRTPMARVGEPEEVAAAVTFLAWPGASYITGQCLAVDGGMSAKAL